MKAKPSTYKEAIDYLYSLQKYGIKFGLSKTSNLLAAFDNPHIGQRYIHIGGSNGKGSVGSIVDCVLREAGYRVGFYTSPHLLRFTERFRVNGDEMPAETATQLIAEVMEKTHPDHPPTFFEATTAMALLYFARQQTDIAIMEVGMGGRLDATNVIQPVVSAITNIALEHQDFLGSRLLEIAKEKAGIIKGGADLVTGATQSKVIKTFEAACKEKGSPFWRLGRHFRYRSTPSGLAYYGIDRTLKGLQLGLVGQFQNRNAALALGIIELLIRKGLVVRPAHMNKGLREVRWPGRMQVVSQKPLILLDGAHNPAACRELKRAVKAGFNYKRVILILGVMEDKDLEGVLHSLLPLSDYVVYTRPEYYRAAEPSVLSQIGRPLKKEGEVIMRLSHAIDRGRAMAGPEDLILITGSLFTVGEALGYFFPNEGAWDPM
jgi:dihydrofolate synthase/folylpolyglutamate synthase